MIARRHRYILLIVIIIYYFHHDSKWHNLSWVLYTYWSSSDLGCMQVQLNSVSHFRFGYFDLVNPVDQVKHGSQGNGYKFDSAYICSSHAQDQYCILSFHQMVTIIEFHRLFFLLQTAIIMVLLGCHSAPRGMSSHLYHSTMSPDTYVQSICPSSHHEIRFHGFYYFQRLYH